MRTLLLAMIGLALVGCADDTRISLHEMREMQAEIDEREPVAVRQSDLALAEVQRFRAQPGDVLELTLIGLDTEDALKPTELRARVAASGNIRLPMVGEISVGGRDLAQIEQAIYSAYVPDFSKSMTANVAVSEASTVTVLVNGAAGRRGIVNLSSDKRNLLYALAQADAFIDSASGVVHIHPVRATREKATYDLREINDLRLAMTADPLESGDMIVVDPAEAPAIYLTGLVNSPGPIVVGREGRMTVMQAIAAGAGLVDFLEPGEATLWRKLDNGQRVRVKLPLNDILAGSAEDVALHPGDILDVPHTASTRFRQWAVENIRLGPFGMTAVYDPLADRRARIVSDNNGGNLLQSIFLNTLNSTIPTLIQPTAVP